MGLRFPPEVTDHLFRGVQLMFDVRESSFYQLAVTEGRREGMREGLREGLREGQRQAAIRLLCELGRKRFGPVPPATLADIEGITSPERLERLADRLLDATSWDDLLATP
jgi:predicted transposase YdaD